VEQTSYPPPPPRQEPAFLVGLTYGVLAVVGVLLSRLGAVVPAAPWMIILIVLSSRRPEGDLVVTGTTAGYVYMFGGVLAALIAIVWTRSAHSWLLAGAPRPPGIR
jgi:hypothetical protein